MARPRSDNPKRNIVAFRLTDVELAFLKTAANRVKLEGEKFPETVGRIIRTVLLTEAKRQFNTLREMEKNHEKPVITLTVEDVEKRRELSRKCPPSFASNPSVVARPCGATQDNTERGQATAKIENWASPSGSLPQRGSESAGKIE